MVDSREEWQYLSFLHDWLYAIMLFIDDCD